MAGTQARDLFTRRSPTVVASAVTSPAFAQASLARLADLLGGHWAIENGLQWVRDVAFAETPPSCAPGPARRSWPARRNLVIGALSRAGPVNLAAALGHHGRDPRRPLATLNVILG